MISVEILKKSKRVLLDKSNLDDLPREEGVYLIFANDGKPDSALDCLYVGETENLRETITAHFSEQEPNICLKHFLESYKKIVLCYELMPNSKKGSRREIEVILNKKYEPQCNSPV